MLSFWSWASIFGLMTYGYFIVSLCSGPPKGEINCEEGIEFDPIIHHNEFCPWINGNVAAAESNSQYAGDNADAAAMCGWQLTLDALDALQSMDHIQIQMMQSESAASLYKVGCVAFDFFLLDQTKGLIPPKYCK